MKNPSKVVISLLLTLSLLFCFAGCNAQDGNSGEKQQNTPTEPAEPSAEDLLEEYDSGYNSKCYTMDLEDGKGTVTIAMGYNNENGVISNIALSYTIYDTHSEYEDYKLQFSQWSALYAESEDKSIEQSSGEFSDHITYLISVNDLNKADRSERISAISQLTNIAYDEDNCVFFIEDTMNYLEESGYSIRE